MDANGLSDPFVVIKYGNVKFKTPYIRKTLNPKWKNAEYQFNLSDNTDPNPEFNFGVYDWDLVGAAELMGEVVVTYKDLHDGKNLNRWWKLCSPKAEGSDEIGEMRLTLQYSSVTILHDISYDELFFHLIRDKMQLTKMLAAVALQKEKPVAECLVKAFEMRKTGVHFLKEITSAEIQDTSDPNIIFRANTVASKAVDAYMKIVGMPYLHRVLKPIIQEIFTYAGKRSCELDTVRIESEGGKAKDAKKNFKTLMYYVDKFWVAIRDSLKWCPSSFRNIFEHIRITVQQKWPNNEVVSYTAPGGFIFLRFFCPAILGPKLFGLCEDHPPANIARDLTLIAKTLQNLSNLVNFGKKEPYMIEVNPFIEEHIPQMKDFIDKVCSIPTDPVDEVPSQVNALGFGREMARVHGHLVAGLKDMKNKFLDLNTSVIEPLEQVLSDLSAHLNSQEGSEQTLVEAPPLEPTTQILDFRSSKPAQPSLSQSTWTSVRYQSIAASDQELDDQAAARVTKLKMAMDQVFSQ
eukprot:TRINITY_DN4722_c0_g3_i2.p1 TRINITY_DN4722_c0_g3~~TRINITY_DN4722_c0_g3_i2.p1  ORF type:complete len:559 (-),score=111.69 TRINITY_DN4722_c0_g3_i2:132-1688(-)